MASFNVGDKVAIVNKKYFFEDIEKGKYSNGEIIRKSTYKDGDIYYAKDEDGSVYCSASTNLESFQYEFITYSYLAEVMERKGKEMVNTGYMLIEKARGLL